MKFNKLAIFFVIFFPLLVIAQEKASCKVGSFEFVCPENLQIEKNNKSKNLYIGFDSKSKVYVYAFSPDKTMKDDALIEKTLENVFSDIYSSKYEDYQIKDSKDFWGNSTWSKFEVSKFAKVGFNKAKNHTLHLQYVQLLVNNKQFLLVLYMKDL